MKKKSEIETPEEVKKFFDPENYSTVIVAKEEEGTESVKDQITTLIELLSSKDAKEMKHDTLKILKEENGLDMLIKAINKAKNASVRQNLVAACWESGLDASKQFSFFVNLALEDEFAVALEALTVIEEMQGPFDTNILQSSIQRVDDALTRFAKEDKGMLMEQLHNALKSFVVA